jgi:phenylacetate-CoA ligase
LELQAVQPEVIEGEPVYLSLLTRALQHRHVVVPSVRTIILTYGKASHQHGCRLAEAFPGAIQVDLYGSTEAGYIFVGDAFADNAQVIDGNAFVELRPWREGLNEVFQIIVTTRDRAAMPLLRYATGDLVQKFAHGYRLLGRESGVFLRADGAVVSPAGIDAALPDDFSCWHWSLVQTSANRWDFQYVADAVAPAGVDAALAAVVGADARVNLFRRKSIAPAASGKFALLKPLAR